MTQIQIQSPTRHTPDYARMPRPGLVPRGIRLGLNGTARLAPRLAGHAAFGLWRRPGPPVEVRRGERAVHDAAAVSVVEHGGRPVVAYAWGDGRRPILLVHGWGSRASRFADLVIALLDAGLSPVSYDAWAHGASSGPAGTILEHQAVIGELERRHGPFEAVVAHSLGVPVAAYAVRMGLGAGRLVLISGMSDFGYLVDAFCARLGLRAPIDQELRRVIERRLFGGDPGIWAQFSVSALPGREVLVVHDVDDRVVDRAQADPVVARQYGRGTLLETTGLGHSRILGDPEVVEATVDFLTEERR